MFLQNLWICKQGECNKGLEHTHTKRKRWGEVNNIFIVLLMIFFHIVDDYYLQGWLASAKQKKYWQENAPEFLYKYDYIWALIMHSFSWSFMIMLPIAYIQHFNISLLFLIIFSMNLVMHAIVDDLKANKRKINLWADQLIHIWQIVFTAGILL